jgi:hypothetical protein
MNRIKLWIRDWLGIDTPEHRVNTLEELLYHKKSKLLGFATLKKHLQRPDVPLPRFAGRDIEQD